MTWLMYAAGIATGVALTPLTYRVAEAWWTRHLRRR